ncbi:MAG: hypothetical protein K2K55_01215 [Duncaniella sp.]|nr:hypothetical protein [Duncaniella sp.]
MTEILRSVLPTDLIAPTLSVLASQLGFKGRSTLYRIVRGEASDNSVGNVCCRLASVFGLTPDNLEDMVVTVSNTSLFSTLMKEETENFRKFSPTDIIMAFVDHDYSWFSKEFRLRQLDGIRRLEQTDPEAFFAMLAYFYFKSLHTDFYAGPKSHKDRCAAIMEPLGRRLMKKYPANGVAAFSVTAYSRSIFNQEKPILWNLVGSLAVMLRYYATPELGKQIVREMWLLGALADRTYWTVRSTDALILLSAEKLKIAGSGYYEVFLIEKERRTVQNVGTISFLGDSVMSYRDKCRPDVIMSMYDFDDGTLTFGWSDDTEAPVLLSGRWERLPTEYSESLREIDRSISDEKLLQAVLKAEGFESIEGAKVRNVRMSRTDMEITLQNDVSYRIPYADAPFLEFVSPNDEVFLARRIVDSEVFIFWPQLMHAIPLSCFS